MPFGESARGDADETTGAEHLDRPRALADEMRGRLEAGAGDAAAGQERDRAGSRYQPIASATSRLLVLGE